MSSSIHNSFNRCLTLQKTNNLTVEDNVAYNTFGHCFFIEEGKEIYELVERNIEISPVGVIPVYNQDGYIFIHADSTQDVHIYQYHHSVIVNTQENMRTLSLNYLYCELRSIANPYEQMKLNLIKHNTALPHAATYLCHSKLCFPLMETLLPVTKRILMCKVFP